MSPKIVIRSETDADVSAITEVTVAAFHEGFKAGSQQRGAGDA